MARLAGSLRGKGEKMYNILVCDDEKDIVSALEIYLTADGYQVFTAYNGRQAVDILNKEEIESCQRFSMDHFMWTCLQKPEAYGWMGYLKDRGLFVKLVCKEKDPKRVYHNFMDMVCEDSAMEVFLAFPEKGEALTNDVMYLNFEVNSNGAMYAAYGKGRKGRKPMPEKYLQVVDCKADRQEDSWTLTYLIPESYLKEEAGVEKLDGETEFYCNFYKIAQTPEIEHYASWSPIDNPTPNFHLPVFFAKAQIEE